MHGATAVTFDPASGRTERLHLGPQEGGGGDGFVTGTSRPHSPPMHPQCGRATATSISALLSPASLNAGLAASPALLQGLQPSCQCLHALRLLLLHGSCPCLQVLQLCCLLVPGAAVRQGQSTVGTASVWGEAAVGAW